MKIRRAKISDAKQICEIHVRSISEVCKNEYSIEQRNAWVGEKTPEKYHEEIRSQVFYVAESDGRIVGFAILNETEKTLRALYVNPEDLRRRAGQRLFDQICSDGADIGLEDIWFDSTLTAVPFYEAMGCVVTEETIHELDNGVRIPSVRMSKELKGASNKSLVETG